MAAPRVHGIAHRVFGVTGLKKKKLSVVIMHILGSAEIFCMFYERQN